MRNQKLKRQLSTIALGGVATLIMAGCAGGNAAEPVADRDLGTPVAGVVPEGVFDGVTLTYAASGGIFQDGQRDAAWDPFAKISGSKFLQDAFDAGKLKAMVDSGNVTWDITNATQFDTARGCGTLYEEYDYSQVDISKVPEGTITDKCMVPNILYGLVVAYNTDAFGDNPPTSAADFFDTDKFPGKRTVSQSPYVDPQTVEFALAADGEDINNVQVADIATAFDKYRALGDNVIGWTSGAQAQQQLESGEAVMGLVWSGRGYGAAAAGAPVAPMWDEWMIMVDSTAIPKGVKDPQAAFAAVNFYLGAEQQARMTELTSYGPVNVDAEPKVDATLKTWLTTEHLKTGHAPNIDFWVENYDALSAAWASWVTGS
ncbi:extracellular solute-binding protein [Cryobacterium sp. TMT1-62]|uniref:extracellular solute-binding protein n=1 Tax=unclassified Cryobacterium TaxID=2649013 RepID=UPI00106A24E7|nr:MULTISPECIES: extracellular solute-binding protein [unclassified Cryobacterium]TFB56195.1 extracellular solute-binding protein [Cryobacterium sp. Sr3]TFC32967.1 extracellular solute-binding protein [Cryobacterium sp. TMT2-14]TFC54761.1 extracellular solute-binding protein [Cryobacterium sp. TMT2-17-1]TFD36361.1 extracellular solute-binding protein [Cryobacterium sp. TMT1-62]